MKSIPNGSDSLKKPSLLQQLLPYAFAIGILVWVFTGMKTSVVDERHVLQNDWQKLAYERVLPDTLVIKNSDGSITYCGTAQNTQTGQNSCEGRPDYYFKLESDSLSILRIPEGRIASDAIISAEYAHKIGAGDLVKLLHNVDLSIFLPFMLLNIVAFFLADVFSFGWSYRRFNVPGMQWRELMMVRGGPYLIQIGLAPLAEVLFPLYMLRVKKVPISHTLSSNLWTFIIDLAAILSFITPAVIYNVFVNTLIPDIGMTWVILCAVFWIVFIGNIIFWNTSKGKRFAETSPDTGTVDSVDINATKNRGILKTFSNAKVKDYAYVYIVRILLWISFIIANYAAVRAVGMNPPLSMAIIAMPLVVMSIFMPIGVGGYGGPQLIAWFLFVKVGGVGQAEQAIMYSFLFSTAFLIGRAIIGTILFRPFWKRCFNT